MATKFHVKRNDQVVVIAGSHKGKTGKVLEILAAKSRARVEGVAMMKRHLKKSEKHPQGAIVELEGSVHTPISCSSRSSTRASARRPPPKSPPRMRACQPGGPHELLCAFPL